MHPTAATPASGSRSSGAGGYEIDDSQAGPSYLVWIDNQARLLVDTASGSAARYDEAGADFNDLDAIVLTQSPKAANTTDLPAFVAGSINLGTGTTPAAVRPFRER